MSGKYNEEKMKNIKVLILLLVILLVILVVYRIIHVSTVDKQLRYLNSSNINEGTIGIGNMYAFGMKYKGDVELSTVDKTVYYFASELAPEYKNIDDIERYYNRNVDKITRYLGVANVEDFSKIVKSLQALPVSDLKVKSMKCYESSIKGRRLSTAMTVGIEFEGLDEYYLIDVDVLDKTLSQNESSVKISRNYATDVIYNTSVKEEFVEEKMDNKVIHMESTGRVY